jgi:hypothetical protein
MTTMRTRLPALLLAALLAGGAAAQQGALRADLHFRGAANLTPTTGSLKAGRPLPAR